MKPRENHIGNLYAEEVHLLVERILLQGQDLVLVSQIERSQGVDLQNPPLGLSRLMAGKNLAISLGQSPRGNQPAVSVQIHRILTSLA